MTGVFIREGYIIEEICLTLACIHLLPLFVFYFGSEVSYETSLQTSPQISELKFYTLSQTLRVLYLFGYKTEFPLF